MERIDTRLGGALTETRAAATEAARQAAVEAIRSSQEETSEAARSPLRAAHDARRQAWRYFGGFWVWLSAAAALGGLLVALVLFHF
ncbi:MAG: hypothetical protein DI498_06870 [Paracoccus denitrificans]|nr:MAG: hypothetical protein DI498_06870 [Paracoccus denitrificans]PZO84800.1 MAG: hypothetical protein DI633_06870 [Paracoccus denitrificans]